MSPEYKNQPDKLLVAQCADFEVNGSGDNSQWDLAKWNEMGILDETEDEYETKFKILYSAKGIYVLGYCEDKTINTEYTEDQDDLWEGDVFEVFLQTDPENSVYFEYEINQLNAELVLLVPNNDGAFMGWAPWHYEGIRKVEKAVKIHGGNAEPGAKISGWTAEMFFPYQLFSGFKNTPPSSGTEWKANFYRIDHDTNKPVKWSWKPIEKSFHEYKKYGNIVFK